MEAHGSFSREGGHLGTLGMYAGIVRDPYEGLFKDT